MIGPSAGSSSWNDVLAKFDKRVAQWSEKGLGLQLSTWAYRIYIHSLLGFVAQLCEPPPDLMDHFRAALRRMIPGPGNWISDKDLTNLTEFGFKVEFPHPLWMPMAAKIRVLRSMVPEAKKKAQELREVHSNVFRRPLGSRWHYNSFATILVRNEAKLAPAGISASRTATQMAHTRGASSFQHAVEEQVRRSFGGSYDAESRLRNRMTR